MKINSKKFLEAMAVKCITGQELKERADVGAETITKAKRGADLNPATVGRLARALDITVSELVG